jgi:hypothetical protein
MSAASDEFASDFKAFSFVGDLVSFRVKLVGSCRVEVSAFLSDSKIR